MIINSLVVVTLSLDITTLTADPSPSLTNKFVKVLSVETQTILIVT